MADDVPAQAIATTPSLDPAAPASEAPNVKEDGAAEATATGESDRNLPVVGVADDTPAETAAATPAVDPAAPSSEPSKAEEDGAAEVPVAGTAVNGEKMEGETVADAAKADGETQVAGTKRPPEDDGVSLPAAKKARISGEDEGFLLVDMADEEDPEKPTDDAEAKAEGDAMDVDKAEPPPEAVAKEPAWFDSIAETDTCDICFQVERRTKRDKGIFIKCSGPCALLVHDNCYGPEELDAETRLFECDACMALSGKSPKEEEAPASTPTRKGKKGKKRGGTPSRKVIVPSPGPLPPEAEAQDDGRLYPAPPKDEMVPTPAPAEGDEEKNDAVAAPSTPKPDVFCQLCLRRDVMGGMKATDEGTWAHMACTMSTFDIFTGDDGLVGVKKALQKSASIQKTVAKDTGKPCVCDACGLGGGLLIRCAHKDEKKKKPKKPPKKKKSPKKSSRKKNSEPEPEPEPEVPPTPKRKCTGFIHPLCAEIADRTRVIMESGNGDVIYYKCEAHSYVGRDLCGICSKGTRQFEMLECDGCKKGHHMGCLTPKLEEVPEGDWFCPNCLEKKYKRGELERPSPPTPPPEPEKPEEVENEAKLAEPGGEAKTEESSEKEGDNKEETVEKPAESDEKPSAGEEKPDATADEPAEVKSAPAEEEKTTEGAEMSAEAPAGEKPSEAADAGEDKPAEAADAGEDKPAEAADAGEDKPAEAADAGEDKPVEAADAGEDKPAEAADAGEDKPAEAADAGEDKPAEAADAGEDKSAEAAAAEGEKLAEG